MMSYYYNNLIKIKYYLNNLAIILSIFLFIVFDNFFMLVNTKHYYNNDNIITLYYIIKVKSNKPTA